MPEPVQVKLPLEPSALALFKVKAPLLSSQLSAELFPERVMPLAVLLLKLTLLLPAVMFPETMMAPPFEPPAENARSPEPDLVMLPKMVKEDAAKLALVIVWLLVALPRIIGAEMILLPAAE